MMMMNSKTTSTLVPTTEGVVLQGYHKKLKTMKKKYFVLFGDTSQYSARLEYYDNEKKFKSKSLPKRTIILKNCFNINRRLDTKHKHVIALSIKEGGFCIVFDTEDELNIWLRTLLILQRGEVADSDPPKPDFEHVWQVQVQRKGLGEDNGLIGNYHVCLKSTSIVFVRIGPSKTNFGEKRLAKVEFYLTTIRRCGDSQCFFFMEIGRNSAFGAGELWMETEDILIAKNMHSMILNSMSSKRGEEGFVPIRQRSSSANEASKPVSVIQRRQTHSAYKPLSSSSPMSSRERCDSLPSRNRTISECSNQNDPNIMPPPKTVPSHVNRPHSMYNSRQSHSPPTNLGHFESEGSSLSIDETDSFATSLNSDDAGNYIPRLYNTQSQQIIPEENNEQFCWYEDNGKKSISDHNAVDNLNNHHNALSLPLKQNNLNRKVISNYNSQQQHHHITSIENQVPYIDTMCSPCGSSPCDPNGSGYMPISPAFEGSRAIYTTSSSGGHSRASSLAEDPLDGYVPMSAPHQSQDFIDIDQPMKQSNVANFSPAASSSSITSGTPSTDIKFSEYPLEKVSSCFTPDNEDMDQSNEERPVRAYSVGSRLEYNNKRKLRIELFTNNEPSNIRTRALSVGSRAKVPRCEGFTNIPCHSNNNNITTNVNINANNIKMYQKAKDSSTSSKSSSVPSLMQKNQSIERMSDLMEIDFSRNNETKKNTNSSSRVIKYSSPIAVPNVRNQFYNNAQFSLSESSNEYLEMKPRNRLDTNEKQHSLSKLEEYGEGYLEMKPVSYSSDSGNNNIISSSPTKIKSKSVEKRDPEYINMVPYISQNANENDDLLINRSPSMPIKIKAQEINCVNTESVIFPKTSIPIENSDDDDVKLNENDNFLINTNIIKDNNINSPNMNSLNASRNKVDSIIDDYANMTIIDNNIRQISQDDSSYTIIASSNIENKLDNNTLKVKKLNLIGGQGSSSFNKDFIDNNIKEFKPITSKNDEQYFKNINRDLIRRPNSVNSEKISPLKAISRPNSANSENLISTAVSTSSSSSTLCGSSSSSTLCNSSSNKSQSPLTSCIQQSSLDAADTLLDLKKQQEFVLTSRPPSVSSEKELNYASLDLPQSTNDHKIINSNNIINKTTTGGESSSTSPSPNGSFCQKQPTFTYVQIDFSQSENKTTTTSRNVPLK